MPLVDERRIGRLSNKGRESELSHEAKRVLRPTRWALILGILSLLLLPALLYLYSLRVGISLNPTTRFAHSGRGAIGAKRRWDFYLNLEHQ